MNYKNIEKRKRVELRAKRIAKVITFIVIFGLPFVAGFFTGHKIANKQAEYRPDPCQLEVVVCEGENSYE